MNKLKLATQLNIIFTFITILSGMFFLFIVNLSFKRAYENQNQIYLDNYFKEVLRIYESNPSAFNYNNTTKYNDFFIVLDDQVIDFSDINIEVDEFNRIANLFILKYFIEVRVFKGQTILF